VLDRPRALVATRTKNATRGAAIVTCKVADVPVGSMTVDVTVTSGGPDAGIR